jgi:hypothetical protein
MIEENTKIVKNHELNEIIDLLTGLNPTEEQEKKIIDFIKANRFTSATREINNLVEGNNKTRLLEIVEELKEREMSNLYSRLQEHVRVSGGRKRTHKKTRKVRRKTHTKKRRTYRK